MQIMRFSYLRLTNDRTVIGSIEQRSRVIGLHCLQWPGTTQSKNLLNLLMI